MSKSEFELSPRFRDLLNKTINSFQIDPNNINLLRYIDFIEDEKGTDVRITSKSCSQFAMTRPPITPQVVKTTLCYSTIELGALCEVEDLIDKLQKSLPEKSAYQSSEIIYTEDEDALHVYYYSHSAEAEDDFQKRLAYYHLDRAFKKEFDRVESSNIKKNELEYAEKLMRQAKEIMKKHNA